MKFMTWIFLIISIVAAQTALAFPVLSSVDILSINKSSLEKINGKDTLVIVGTLEGNLCNNSIDSLMVFPKVEAVNKKGEVKITSSLHSSSRSELSFVGTICLTDSHMTPFKIGLDVSGAFQDAKAKTLKLNLVKSYEENLTYVVKKSDSGLSLTAKPEEVPEDEFMVGVPRITINKVVSAPYPVKTISEPKIEEELIRPDDSYAGNEVLFLLDVEGPTLRCPMINEFFTESFFVSDAGFKELTAKLYYGVYATGRFKDEAGFEAAQLSLVPVTCEFDRETTDSLYVSVRIDDRDEDRSSDETPPTVTKIVTLNAIDPSGGPKEFKYKATRNEAKRWTIIKE